jgi:plastocyanin
VRRQYQQQYDNSYPQKDDSYNGDNKYTQPSYDNKYTQPSDDNKYTPPSYDNKYTPPSYDNKYTTPVMDDKTPMMYETTSAPYETPTYGSGQSNWGNSYDDCVSRELLHVLSDRITDFYPYPECVAKYGAPPMEWSPSEPMPPPKSTGAVHTIMVAPTQGVLRYWPFAVNATVGDTIRYVWTTPANHTATLSSALTICNKSAKADELNWVSGVRNASAGTQTCTYPRPLASCRYLLRAFFQSTSPSKPTNSNSSTARLPNTAPKACSVWSNLRWVATILSVPT